MDLAACVLLHRMIDECMEIALDRPITTRRVGIQPTARSDGEVRCLLHRLHRKIAGRVDDDRPLATDPGDNRGPVFSVVPPTGLAFPAAPTRAAAQRLLPALLRLTLVPRGVIEVIGFDCALSLALHLVGQGGIAQPPAPAVAGPDMHPQLSRNALRRTRQA